MSERKLVNTKKLKLWSKNELILYKSTLKQSAFSVEEHVLCKRLQRSRYVNAWTAACRYVCVYCGVFEYGILKHILCDEIKNLCCHQ